MAEDSQLRTPSWDFSAFNMPRLFVNSAPTISTQKTTVKEYVSGNDRKKPRFFPLFYVTETEGKTDSAI
jgi:hypothetical protein